MVGVEISQEQVERARCRTANSATRTRIVQAFANWGAQQHELWPSEFLGAYAAGAIDHCVVQARLRALSP